MPYSQKFAEEWIGRPDTGRTRVFSSIQTSGPFDGKIIPLDGRRYISEGKIHFRNGVSLSAKFDIDTTHFDLIVLNSVTVFLNGLWYKWYEPELVAALNAENSDDILPFKWTPLLPLKFQHHPPYPMRFHDGTVEKVVASIRVLHSRENLSYDDEKALLFFDPIHWH